MSSSDDKPGTGGPSAILDRVIPETETPAARVETPPAQPYTAPAPDTATPANVTYPPTAYTPSTPPYNQPYYGQPQPQPSYPYPAPQAQPKQSAGNAALWVIGGVLLAIIVFAGILFAVTQGIAGLVRYTEGPTTVDTRSVPAAGITSANINLDMKAGNITVRSGSANMVDATFTYNVSEWKPNVNSYTSGSNGVFEVTQPDSNINTIDTRYDWEFRLGKVPTNLKVNLGAGNINMYLGGLPLKSLTVDNHAGNTTVDFTGNWDNNMQANITGSVGNTTIRVPENVGVRITTNKNLGNITANGFTANGNIYTNDAYGKSPITLDIKTTVNVGNLVLENVK